LLELIFEKQDIIKTTTSYSRCKILYNGKSNTKTQKQRPLMFVNANR